MGFPISLAIRPRRPTGVQRFRLFAELVADAQPFAGTKPANALRPVTLLGESHCVPIPRDVLLNVTRVHLVILRPRRCNGPVDPTTQPASRTARRIANYTAKGRA